jgi:hypothetical protein
METQTKLSISFKQNPAVGEACQGKQVGDAFEGDLKATIAELSNEGVVLNLEAVVPDGYEVAPGDDADTVSSPAVPAGAIGVGAGDQTIPSAIASMVQRKKT